MGTEPDTNANVPKSGQSTEPLATPTLMPRRLFHEHGPVNRRKILAAATSGIVGVILGERLLAPLRAEAQVQGPRGILPNLSGGSSQHSRQWRRWRRKFVRHRGSQQDEPAGGRVAGRLSLADAD